MTTEREGIQRQCLDLLLALEQAGQPVWSTRTNSGKVRTDTGHYIQLCRDGTGDITACIRGSFIAIECKTPKGHLRESQKKAAAAIESAGGKYYRIKEISELRRILREDFGIDVKTVFNIKA